MLFTEMKARSLNIVLLALIVGGSLLAGSYWVSQRWSARQMAASMDELEWLRQEFRLSDVELARVRELHEGYLPGCQEMCQQIAAKKLELETALAEATNLTEDVELKLRELGVLRAHCQSRMLQHFYEVSQAMPPEQGRRYLAEMQRLALGFHEQIEQSMSRTPAHEPHHH